MTKVKWSSITTIAEVKSVVTCDLDGALSEATVDLDGETTAAISGFVTKAMTQVGDRVGTGALQRITISGKTKAAIITVVDEGLLTVFVDPSKPTAPIEKKLDLMLQR